MKLAPPPTVQKPEWFPKAQYAVFAAVFTAAFFLIGLMLQKENTKAGKIPWSHPFRSLPDFVIAWVIIAACLPTFVAAFLIYLMTRSTLPVLRAIRRLLVSVPTFDDEYSNVAQQLTELRRKTQATGGDEKILARIEEALQRVRAARDRSHLSSLREMLYSVEGLEDQLTGLDELNRELTGRPSR